MAAGRPAESENVTVIDAAELTDVLNNVFDKFFGGEFRLRIRKGFAGPHDAVLALAPLRRNQLRYYEIGWDTVERQDIGAERKKIGRAWSTW